MQDSSHVIRIHGFQIRTNYTYILLEIASIGDLWTFAEHFNLQESEMISIFYDILIGVKQMHSLGVVHLDLKPNNLLVRKDGRILIGDFGFSEDIASGKQLYKCTGTPGVSAFIIIIFFEFK